MDRDQAIKQLYGDKYMAETAGFFTAEFLESINLKIQYLYGWKTKTVNVAYDNVKRCLYINLVYNTLYKLLKINDKLKEPIRKELEKTFPISVRFVGDSEWQTITTI